MTLDNFRTIELIWDTANKSIIKTIKTASSDTTGRYLSVKILDGGQEVTLNNAKLQLYWEHPNFNTSGTDDFNIVNNGGLFKMTFSNEMLTNIGKLNTHLILTLPDGTITSDGFEIEVIKGSSSGVVIPSNGENAAIKAVYDAIDKLNNFDGGPSIFMDTLTELQTTYPDGTAGVALVRETDPAKIYAWNGAAWEDFGDYQGIEIKDEVITTQKIADSAVTNKKLAENSVNHKVADFILGGHEGKNIFDKTKAVIGYRLDTNDGVTPIQDQSFAYIKNIPVEKHRNMFRNLSGALFIFDDEQNLLQKWTNSAEDISFNTGDGVYVSFNMRIYNVDATMLEYGSVGTAYEDYYVSEKTLDSSIKITAESLDKSELKDIYSAGTGIVIEDGVISNVLNVESLSDQYYQVVSNNVFRIYQRIGEGDYAGYTYATNGLENYMRLMGISIFSVKQGTTVGKSYELISGTMTSTSTENHYTVEVGTKVGVSFKGTSVTFNHLQRNDGGVWGVTVDGVAYPSISTWGVNTLAVSKTIAADLPDTNHDVVLEFLGTDPNNPPSTAPARGWILFPGTFSVLETGQGGYDFSEKGAITDDKSNKDFAITVEPMDISGEAQFFPLHSGNDTINVVEKHLTIDGNSVDLSKPTDILPFRSGAFLEHFEAKLTYESGIRAKGTILWAFDTDSVGQEFELTFIKPSNLVNGYLFMLPIPPTTLERVKTNRREETYRDSEQVGISSEFSDLSANTFRVTYIGDYQDVYLEAGITNYSHALERLWLQRRDENIYKLYPQPFLNTNVNVGETVFFDGYFKVGEIKGINI